MAPFRKILVPLDFSRCSDDALEAACELSKRFDAPIMLLHAYVIPTYPLPEGYVMASAETVAEVLAKTKEAMDKYKQRAQTLGAQRVDVTMTEGPAFAEIIRIARESGADLIVMGTHGRTGIRHALLGSVAEKVVRKAPCAVLTIRDSEHRFEKP
jgi:nucleotide-binding universal stress UspA family protein